jgi:hypothetical protein
VQLVFVVVTLAIVMLVFCTRSKRSGLLHMLLRPVALAGKGNVTEGYWLKIMRIIGNNKTMGRR